jgi:hypothetical protein
MGTKVFFFAGGLYARYDKPLDRVDAGPLPIAGNWPGMAQIGFANRLDAAVNWGNGKVFFRGTRCVRYDVAGDKVDEGYPLPIAGTWPGMADAGFADLVDAALPWGNGKVYFFRGDQYFRYDADDDEVDEGSPLSIAEMWPGMEDIGFSSGITATIDLLGETSRIP